MFSAFILCAVIVAAETILPIPLKIRNPLELAIPLKVPIPQEVPIPSKVPIPLEIPIPLETFEKNLEPLRPNNVIFLNKCLEDLGCFYTGPPFFNIVHRPISLPPYNLENMKTKFWLYTAENTTDKQLLEPNYDSLRSSSFDPKLDTKFIIHGYLSDLGEGDVRYAMKDALLKQGYYNVIIVDWTNSNGRPYAQAVANTRVVGAQIAQLIQFLQKSLEISPESIHLIGHSLGSHIAGYAGERIANISRITGLDPAGPFFQYSEESVRLDRTDAQFLDIIHTDGGSNVILGLGISEPIGTLDFYPNGGAGQPGCQPTFLNITVIGVDITAVGTSEVFTDRMLNSCDHSRANELFTASINDCKFLAVPCENKDKFKSGECDKEQPIQMGFHANAKSQLKDGQKFFFKTSDKYPYCLNNDGTSTA